jgi:hypothetical protein
MRQTTIERPITATQAALEEKKKDSGPIEIGSTESLQSALFLGTLTGAIIGGAVFGASACLIAWTQINLPGLRMLTLSGAAPAMIVAGGIGITVGGLAGALMTLFRKHR